MPTISRKRSFKTTIEGICEPVPKANSAVRLMKDNLANPKKGLGTGQPRKTVCFARNDLLKAQLQTSSC